MSNVRPRTRRMLGTWSEWVRSAENPSARVAWPGCGRGRSGGRTTGSLPHTTVGRQVRLKCWLSPRAGCPPRVRLKRPYLFLVLLSNDQRDKSGGSYDQQPFPKPTSNLKPLQEQWQATTVSEGIEVLSVSAPRIILELSYSSGRGISTSAHIHT